MTGKFDETLRGINEAIDGLDDAVKGMGDMVSTTHGQMSHVSHVSTGVVEGVGQAKQQVYRFAEILEDRRVQKAVAATFIFLLMLANYIRAKWR